MDWFLLAIISAISGAVSNILSRVLMKNDTSDPISYAIVFQVLCTLFIFIFAFWNGFTMPPIQDYPLNFLLLTALYAFTGVLIFKAYQYAQASEVTIVASMRSVWAIVVGVLLLNEVFTMQQTVGALSILGAIILVNLKENKFHISKGTWYALAFATCFGLAVVNDRYIITHSQADAVSYTALAFLLPTIALAITNLKSLVKIKHFMQIDLLVKMVLLSIFYSVSAITFYLALQYGAQVSQLSPITQSAVILTVVLGALFLGEKDNMPKKIIAAILVMVGVYLLK